MIPILPEFLEQHPALEIEIIMDDRSVDLVEEGIDVAIRMGSMSDSTLTARKIGECQRLVMGTPAYSERWGEPQEPKDLTQHQAISLTQPNLGVLWKFRQGSSEIAVTVGGRVLVTAGEGVREAVLAGLGLTVSSEWLFAPELKSGAVRTALTDWQLPTLDLWAVFPTGRRASMKARMFADFVEARLAHYGSAVLLFHSLMRLRQTLVAEWRLDEPQGLIIERWV